MREIERIKSVYRQVSKSREWGLTWSYFNPATLYLVQKRERKLLKLLKRYGCEKLSDKKILDVGCGSGGELRNFIKYGANPQNLYGIDLMSNRIKSAKKLSPHVHYICQSAEKLPYRDNMFDIVTQFTVFSSILEDEMRENMAREMLRVLKPGGIIIWYDLKPPNRYLFLIFSLLKNWSNKLWDWSAKGKRIVETKPVGKDEIIKLFSGNKLYFYSLTLYSGIVRKFIKYSWIMCELLEKIPFLRTHYLAVIRKGKD